LPFALRLGAEFFLPVIAALVVAIALVPMLEWFERRGIPSRLAAGLCVIVFLTIFLLFFTLLRFREKPPVVADNSVLVLRLEGEVPEKPAVELPDFLSNTPQTVTMTALWRSLEAAASDPHIKAVVLQQICPHLVGETRPAALPSQIENDDAAEVFEQRQSEPKLFPAVAAP